MIKRAIGDGLPRGTVLADSAYGSSSDVRQQLRNLGFDYAVGIDPKTTFRPAASRACRRQREEDLKGELGLDDFEGRRFRGWHHHVSVTLCCYAFIVAERVQRSPPRPEGRWETTRSRSRPERHPPPVVGQHHKPEQNSERRRGHCEEVDGHQVFHVVVLIRYTEEVVLPRRDASLAELEAAVVPADGAERDRDEQGGMPAARPLGLSRAAASPLP